jgi:hypothetical protein
MSFSLSILAGKKIGSTSSVSIDLNSELTYGTTIEFDSVFSKRLKDFTTGVKERPQ